MDGTGPRFLAEVLRSLVGAARVRKQPNRAMDLTTAFDRRLKHVPDRWRDPIVDVVDTFETVQIGLRSVGIDDPFILIEAVRLTFDRYDKATPEE